MFNLPCIKMNNILCSVLLMAMIGLTMSSQDTKCTTYPDVEHAVIDGDQCQDAKMTCSKEYEMYQKMECVSGEWIYQKPICRPEDCFEYTTGKLVYNKPGVASYKYNSNEAECNSTCQSSKKCSVWVVELVTCTLYTAPVIYISIQSNATHCAQKCREMNGCLSFSLFNGKECFVFNVTMSMLDTSHGSTSFIAENACQ